MNWLLALVTSAAFVEIFVRLGVLEHARQVNRLARRSVLTIGYKRASDHWKEKAVGTYSVRMMAASLWLGFGMLLAVLPFLVAGFATQNGGDPFFAFVRGFAGIVACTAFAVGYAMVRSLLARAARDTGGGTEGNYDPSSKLLHRLALPSAVAEMSFDIECAVHGKDLPDATDSRHVFVTGLARAGTTVLMRSLHATGAYGSLTYRDMPFVLAPNLWQRLWQGSQKKHEEAIRAHGDGLRHGFDSPEALEEVFWRVQCGGDYIAADRLTPMEADGEVIEVYRKYVALILKATGQPRYLCKNNNHLLRLPSLARAFPQATILVPFRQPLAHAQSLLRQHRRFLEIHRQDPFARQYMQWLVHHEFGADHRPFCFGQEEPPGRDPLTLDYWLEIWTRAYRHVLEHHAGRVRFFSYERFTLETEAVWPPLCRKLGLPEQALPVEINRPGIGPETAQDDALFKDAASLHAELLEAGRWLV